MCTRPEFEETKFESKDTMGFADEEYPSMKGDTLLRLLPELAELVVDMGGENK